MPFASYAAAWIAERPNLRPKTVQLYEYLLRSHLRPALGEIVVKSIGDAQPGDSGLVFTSPAGRPLRHSQFRSRVWLLALTELKMTGLHFHDLRHAGNDLAAASGATLRELMVRMGHSTTRAALIYLHDSDECQRKIAESLDVLLREQLAGGVAADKRGWGSHRCGTNLAQAGGEE